MSKRLEILEVSFWHFGMLIVFFWDAYLSYIFNCEKEHQICLYYFVLQILR